MTREEYIKTFERLCKKQRYCGICEINSLCYNKKTSQKAYDIVQAVEQWDKEHPIKTNRDIFYRDFGFQGFERLDGFTITKEWLNAEYQEPKGADDETVL